MKKIILCIIFSFLIYQIGLGASHGSGSHSSGSHGSGSHSSHSHSSGSHGSHSHSSHSHSSGPHGSHSHSSHPHGSPSHGHHPSGHHPSGTHPHSTHSSSTHSHSHSSRPHYYNSYYYGSRYYGSRYNNIHSSESTPVYLIDEETTQETHKFLDCDKHYMTTETTILHYSDGTRRVYTNSTIFNSDGTPIVEGCQEANHVVLENKHYFIVRRNRVAQILDEKGVPISERKYSYIEILKPNRLLVRYDKKYGIIDISEKSIVPIKYQKFNDVGYGLFITNLNGYYGILDINNNQLVENNCDNIKPLHDTYVLKKQGKFGLVSKEGKLLLEPVHDRIKKLGEYILVKDKKQYSILDMSGNSVNENKYKKVRLDRNTLQGRTSDDNWVNVSTGLEYKKE